MTADIRKRILVIDDDEEMLALVQIALEEDGYLVSTANSGQTAISSYSTINPDLVLLDIRMPLLNGYEVLEKIREISNVPVIMLTGVQDANSVAQSLNLGADDYIRKPFSVQEFLAHVRAKLRRAAI